ncbi:phage tail protein [Mucilaginibacter lappiensis]|uniref:Tail spike domain-containing protein n=1 Tax=Mucilaginibacter lappiensis TaxID=354630 RepID=A0A841J9F2_9SPHI|nr:phage tail protein [Mucilaginibacter lappiensis]MBB6126972.1 hypothetical protein [Mucilaginibacter lappiensis]
MYLPIYFNNQIVSQLPVYDDLAINWELMGANEIPVDIELPVPLYCPIGAYVIYNNQRYTINTSPSPQVSGDASGLKYKYTIVFESYLYKLYDKKLKHLNNKTFDFYGDLQSLCYLIVQNINTIDSGWSVGFCDDLGLKTVSFDKHTCRTALDTCAEAFGVEWYLSGTGKTINFVKQAGSLTTLVFQYGRRKGLYSLGYQYQSDKNIVTRAFGYGSSRNLPKNYRDGATELMFDGFYLEKNVYKNDDPAKGVLYDVKEGDYVNEDIYPKIDGHVTAVSVVDVKSTTFTITDNSLTFDLNNYFSSDTPKVGFTSGQLQGQEFEILSYNNTSKVIKLKVATDAAGNSLPNATVNTVVGDAYTLFDMYLPDEVVKAAEALLKAKTQEWLNENCVPRVLYNLELDPLYARDNNIMLKPGDKVTVKHDALGINALIRVTSISYPVNFPNVITPNTKITATIANFIPYTTTERVISDTIDNQHDIKVVNRTSAEKARLNALNLKKLQSRIFNPDGTLFTGTDSLVAGMATFGYDSQNFNLNNVTFSPNHGADVNALTISGGQLIHRIYKIDGLGYTWTVEPNEWTGLNPAKFYYVYAKCSKVALTGTWEISETPVNANDIVGYYAFNVGILYEVNTDGYRDFEFTKGMTYIVGDQITTGRIKDITGQNYFDLNAGEFNLGDSDNGLDWNITKPATLTIRGFTVAKVVQVGSAGLINARISGITDKGSQSIRFAAGANDEFKVLDDGSMVATKGKIGNFNIDDGGLSNVSNIDAYVQQIKTFPGGGQAGFKIGTGFTQGEISKATYAAYIVNNENRQFEADGTTPHTNVALYVEASGALDIPGLNLNIAAIFKGGVNITGRIYTQKEPGHTGPGWDGFGWSGNVVYKGGSNENRHLTVINGLIVGEAEGVGP